MKVISYDIPYVYGETFKIKFFQDLHVGSPLFDKAGFKSFLADSDEQTYFIGNGDLFDLIISSDVKRYRKGVDDCTSTAVIDEQVERGVELLQPYASRIICIGDGNHEDVIIGRCGTNPVQRLCEKLSTPEHKIEHLGMKWMLLLCFEQKGGGRCRRVVIYGHHGYGGATRTEGGSLTKFSKDMMYDEADIYVFGHVHEKIYKNIPRGYHGGSRYLSKDRLLIIGGCFKKNFTQDRTTSWEESKGFPIRAIGGVTAKIKPDRDWVKMSAEG